jgi:hypothetical protein
MKPKSTRRRSSSWKQIVNPFDVEPLKLTYIINYFLQLPNFAAQIQTYDRRSAGVQNTV